MGKNGAESAINSFHSPSIEKLATKARLGFTTPATHVHGSFKKMPINEGSFVNQPPPSTPAKPSTTTPTTPRIKLAAAIRSLSSQQDAFVSSLRHRPRPLAQNPASSRPSSNSRRLRLQLQFGEFRKVITTIRAIGQCDSLAIYPNQPRRNQQLT